MDRPGRHCHHEFGAAAGHVNPPGLRRLAVSVLLSVLCGLICASSSAAEGKASAAPRSGYSYLSEETRRLQDDEFANPGMLWVQKGEELW